MEKAAAQKGCTGIGGDGIGGDGDRERTKRNTQKEPHRTTPPHRRDAQGKTTNVCPKTPPETATSTAAAKDNAQRNQYDAHTRERPHSLKADMRSPQPTERRARPLRPRR